MRGFRSLNAAKATLKGIEAIRMIVKGGVYDLKPGVCGEIEFIENLFAAKA
jgi:IS6 family transposase